MKIKNQFVRFVTITASDTVDLPGGICDGIMVGTAGNLALVSEAGTVTVIAVPVGLAQFRAKRINSASNTAAGLTACYFT